MPWIQLIVAGLLEIIWAVGMKYSDGLRKPLHAAWTIVAMLLSFYLLALATKRIPLGTAYAAWTGIGAVGVAIAGIILFKEPATAGRLACIFVIVAGVVGLKVLGGAEIH